MDKIFYQDFLMNFPYDELEFPKVTIQYIDNVSRSQEYGTPYNLLDIVYGYNRYISFKKIHNILCKETWSEIFCSIKSLNEIIIVDDIIIKNIEVKEMKEFYLKAYYWNFIQYNKHTFVYEIKSDACPNNL